MNRTITSPRRSSSAWAKYADAFRRISFARFSSRFSRSSSFSRSRSLGRQARPMAGITLRLPHPLAERLGRAPSFGATDCSTAHSEAWAARCSSTIRTARSRTSGENRLGRPIDPILPRNEVSEKPGTIQCAELSVRRAISAVALRTDRSAAGTTLTSLQGNGLRVFARTTPILVSPSRPTQGQLSRGILNANGMVGSMHGAFKDAVGCRGPAR